MTDHDDSSADEGGQVSEVGSLAGGPTPVSDDQSVAGQPTGESGEVQEGRQGPNAITGDEHEPDEQRERERHERSA